MTTEHPHRDPIRRGWTLALLCAVLVLAQVAFAAHQIDHFSHPDGTPCEICLAGAGNASPLTSSPPNASLVRAPRLLPVWFAAEPVLDRRGHRDSLPRAPPAPI